MDVNVQTSIRNTLIYTYKYKETSFGSHYCVFHLQIAETKGQHNKGQPAQVYYANLSIIKSCFGFWKQTNFVLNGVFTIITF